MSPIALRSTGRSRALAVLAAASAVSLSPISLAAQQVERHAIQGEKIAIFNLAGSLRAEPATGREVIVEVRRGGRDAGQLRVNETRRNGTQVLAVAYPGDHIVYPSLGRGNNTMLNVRDDGTFGDGTGRGRRVRISGEGSGTDAFADLRVQIPRGQTISLHLAAGNVSIANVEGNLMVDVSAASITSENTSGVLLLDTGSGAVVVRNARGNVALDTGSGDVSLSGVRADEILVDAGSGTITGDDLTSRSLHMDTGSGTVRLGKVTAQEVHLDTGSGDVEIELTSQFRSMFIDSGSGDITLRVPETIGATIEAETGNGGIDVEIPMQVRRFGRDRISATIGDGSARVSIDSGSGRIRIIKL